MSRSPSVREYLHTGSLDDMAQLEASNTITASLVLKAFDHLFYLRKSVRQDV